MKNTGQLKTIIGSKSSDFENGEIYIYLTNYGENIKILKKIRGDDSFQNEQHKKDYLSQRPYFCAFIDLESNTFFNLDFVDYMEERYSIMPLTIENIGFILREVSRFKKNVNLILKHFLANIK